MSLQSPGHQYYCSLHCFPTIVSLPVSCCSLYPISLLNEYLSKFNLHAVFSEEDIAHWMITREGVVYSFVKEEQDGQVLNFGSFYSLPSSIIRNPKYDTLRAAYSFYNVATTVSLEDLMKDMLTMAKKVLLGSLQIFVVVLVLFRGDSVLYWMLRFE